MNGCYSDAITRDKEQLKKVLQEDFDAAMKNLQRFLTSNDALRNLDAFVDQYTKWLVETTKTCNPIDVIWAVSIDKEFASVNEANDDGASDLGAQ